MIQAKLGMLDPNQRLVRNEDEFKGKGFYEDDSCKHSWLAEGPSVKGGASHGISHLKRIVTFACSSRTPRSASNSPIKVELEGF